VKKKEAEICSMPALIHHSQLLGEEDGTAATTTSLDKKSSSAPCVNATSTRKCKTSPAETSDDTKSSMNSDNITTYSDRKRKTSSVAVDDDLAPERARNYKKSKLCSAEGCTNIIRVCVKHGAKKKQVAWKVAPIKLRSEKCALGTGQKKVDMNAPLRSAQILLQRRSLHEAWSKSQTMQQRWMHKSSQMWRSVHALGTWGKGQTMQQ
jgi:hypothetical protein